MGGVIMLSGPIGAGKTTVARALLPLLAGPLVYIEGDRFWTFIEKPKGDDRRENFRIMMRSITAASVPFARSGYDVLLDFSFPPEFVRVARMILKEIPLDFVFLKPSEAVCATRAAGRSEGKIADYGRYREFYALFDGMEQHCIADDTAEVSSLARRALAGLQAGTFRVS